MSNHDDGFPIACNLEWKSNPSMSALIWWKCERNGEKIIQIHSLHNNAWKTGAGDRYKAYIHSARTQPHCGPWWIMDGKVRFRFGRGLQWLRLFESRYCTQSLDIKTNTQGPPWSLASQLLRIQRCPADLFSCDDVLRLLAPFCFFCLFFVSFFFCMQECQAQLDRGIVLQNHNATCKKWEQQLYIDRATSSCNSNINTLSLNGNIKPPSGPENSGSPHAFRQIAYRHIAIGAMRRKARISIREDQEEAACK